MMGQHLSLEDFSHATPASEPGVHPDELKSIEKAGFDKGYAAGWEDAVASTEDKDKQSRADCAAALQEIDFTYFEARQHVMASFKPLIEAMMAAILPDMARQAITPMVEQELNELAKTIDCPIEILSAPATATELQSLVEQFSKGSVTVATEDTLAPTQVQLRFTDGQTEIDIEAAVSQIQAAVINFFGSADEEERRYG